MDTRKLTYRNPDPGFRATIYSDSPDQELPKCAKIIGIPEVEHIVANDVYTENAAEIVKRWNAYPELVSALEALCDLPADDQGDRVVPAGFLDQARAAIDNA